MKKNNLKINDTFFLKSDLEKGKAIEYTVIEINKFGVIKAQGFKIENLEKIGNKINTRIGDYVEVIKTSWTNGEFNSLFLEDHNLWLEKVAEIFYLKTFGLWKVEKLKDFVTGFVYGHNFLTNGFDINCFQNFVRKVKQ